MARIENTSGRRYEINWKSAAVASIPRCAVDEVTGKRANGSAEIADDVLDEMLAGDAWTRAVFASGDLVRVGAEAASDPVVPEAPVAPVVPVVPVAETPPAAPASDAAQADNRGKSKR